jgi:hypothetical protein
MLGYTVHIECSWGNCPENVLLGVQEGDIMKYEGRPFNTLSPHASCPDRVLVLSDFHKVVK